MFDLSVDARLIDCRNSDKNIFMSDMKSVDYKRMPSIVSKTTKIIEIQITNCFQLIDYVIKMT